MDSAKLAQLQLEEFVEDILTDKKLPGLTDDVRLDVVADMVQTLRELIDRAVIEAMPDDNLEELNKLLDQPETTREQLTEAIRTSGVDTKRIAADTMLRFRELYLEGPGEETK